MNTYAAYYNNIIRDESSSGGVFSLIATQFDVVYGVAMTEDCYGCKFIRCENDISHLRGSKYFQASMGDTFINVRADLTEGKRVLFSGTGCQINGLQCFLQRQYENLFLLDVVCHGVPSPKLWREYACFQEKQYGKLETVNFRCKEEFWKSFDVKENQLYIPMQRDFFMQVFLKNFCLRPSCYECHAKSYKLSDMTIADFWGIEEIESGMDDGKGASLIITRTDKGQQVFDTVMDKLKWKKVSYEEGVKNNPLEFQSVSRPVQRKNFYIDLELLGFAKLKRKYTDIINGPLWKRAVRKGKRVICQRLFARAGDNSHENTKSNMNYGLCLTFQSKL